MNGCTSQTFKGLMSAALIGSASLAFGQVKSSTTDAPVAPVADVLYMGNALPGTSVKAPALVSKSTSAGQLKLAASGDGEPYVKMVAGGNAGPRGGCVSCTDTEAEENCGIPTDTVNGGCNASPSPVFGAITCGGSVCGTGAFDGALRDTDWYFITTSQPTVFNLTVNAEFPVQIGFGDLNNGCPITQLIQGVFGAACTPTTLSSSCLPAGDYIIFIAPQFADLVTCGAQYTATLTCDEGCTPPASAPDACVDAQLIACGDSVLSSNVGATDDGIFPACSFGGSATNSDVWFKFVATQNAADITLCNGAGISDTVVSVYDGCGGAEIACNDDFCGLVSQTTAFGLTLGNTYYIRVAGWAGTPQGEFRIDLTCRTVDPVDNDDCATAELITCGQSVAGSNEGATDDGLFPTCSFGGAPTNSDVWYRFVASSNNAVITTCNGSPIGDTVITLYGACDGNELACNDDTNAGGCGLLSTISATGLTIGNTYYIRVAGWNLTPQGQFTLDLTCPEPTGACCLPTGCVTLGQTDCTNQGGSFQGVGTGCGGQVYTLSNCDDSIEDISGTGTTSTVTGTDDGAQTGVPIGFSFPYYGGTYTSITISNNGFLTFDPTVTGGFFSNGPVPGVGAPNLMIAPLWDDLYSVTQGDVKYQTLSTPNRFVVTWNNMDHFPGTGSSYTFQAVLYETGDIQFRYGSLSNTDGVYSPNIGIENSTGSEGIAIDVAGVGAGNTCRNIDAATVSNPCGTPGACCLPNGDCQILTETGCDAANGTFDGSASCGEEVTYAEASCSDALEDISGTGTLAATASNCDDCSELNVNIGFGFPWFDGEYNTIRICSNGFLSFDQAGPNTFGNSPIPNPVAPNDMIAPFWDDFNPSVAGDVYYQTLASPTRFVVQWNLVRRFGAGAGENTFQAVLYPSGDIAFRYGAMEGSAILSGTVGIENVDASSFVSIDATGPANGSTCRAIDATVQGGVCSSDCACPGDFTGDNSVGLGDLSALLSSFGGVPSNPCMDTDGDGLVGLSDLSAFLSQFGSTCP